MFTLYQTDKILDCSKFTPFEDDKVNLFKNKITFVLGMREKDKKCWLPASSLFSTMFSKGLFSRVVKSLHCVGKGQGTG